MTSRTTDERLQNPFSPHIIYAIMVMTRFDIRYGDVRALSALSTIDFSTSDAP